MTATLLAIGAGLLAGFALGLCVGRSQRGRLAFVAHFLGEEVEAVHGADLDADVAAERKLRLSGDTPAVGGTVELFDGARLAEWREQAERPPVHDFPTTTVDVDGYTVEGPACESCGQPALLRWTGTEWVTLCHDCYEALCRLVDEHPDCPEKGGCRRPEQCATGCHWRRLDALNRPLVAEPKVSD